MEFSTLETLLVDAGINTEESVTKKLHIKRNGTDLTLDIEFKKLSYSKYSYLRKASTRTKKGVPDFDYDKYRVSVVTECLLDPNISKRSLMEKVGASTPDQCLSKLFFAGEIIEICDMILEESGFETDPFRDGVSDDEDSSCNE